MQMWLKEIVTCVASQENNTGNFTLVSVKAGDVVQMVERLLGVHEVLSLMAGAI